MLLVVTHSRSGTTRQLAEAVLAGCAQADPSFEIRPLDAFSAEPADVRAASGIILGTPARFGYMSGALKDFFERIYYPCLEVTAGLPWALFVKGDTDTSGAVASIERIVAGLGWSRALPYIEVIGDIQRADLDKAHEMGATMAAGLDLGIF